MNWLNIANQLAVPVGLAVSSFVVWTLGRLSIWLREKTKNERLARVVDFAGRIAGDIHDTVQDLPPGSDLATVKAEAIGVGIKDLRSRAEGTIANLGGASDATLTGIIKGELGKLRAVAAPATIVVPASPPIIVRTDAPAV